MNIKKCIELLEDLSSYINEEWDRTDPQIVKEIEQDMEAIAFAISILNKGEVIGSLEIKGKKYLISK